jgi:aspartate aminotransferase|tara:strand:- start:2031 stop:3251 length:1221 start_codon:yes stop_codon:yes gene_type:complete
MPGISNKALQLQASPIRKLVPYAETAINQRKEVFFLNIGQPDIETPKNVIDRISNHGLKVIEYSHSAGFESYRKGLSKYYDGVGVDVNHEEIIVTTGGSEALLFGFMSCFDEGDEVIIPEPFYANYNSFSVVAGVKVVPVTSKIENGFALPSIEEFEKRISLRTKGILICNPGNPTGYLYAKEELEKLRDLVLKYDLYLFADEVYREFCYDGKVHHSIMNLKGLNQHAIMIDSVSKRYSMCGARIGTLVTRNKYVLETVLKFAQARLSPPTLGQIAGEEALNTPQSYFDEVIAEYVERRNVLVDALNAIPGVICPKPSGAFYVIAELPVDDAEKFCEWILEHFDYKGKTVMMAPANGFYSMPDAGINQVRLAYVLKKNHLIEAVECLAKALDKYSEMNEPARIPTL